MTHAFRINCLLFLIAACVTPNVIALPSETAGSSPAPVKTIGRVSKSRRVSSKRRRRDPSGESPNSLSANEIKELKAKITSLKDEIDMMQAEMEVMRAESRAMIQRTHIGFLNEFYFSAGMTVITPRPRTLNFQADTGLGAYVGIGHYIGRNHVFELSLDWDLYASLSLRYRYEFHLESPFITFAPVIGIKIKAAPIPPFDNYLDRPQDVKSSFLMLGGMVAFPIEKSLITLELLYLTNQQAFFLSNLGLHYFL